MFFWDPYNSNNGVVNIVPQVSETVLISIHSVFFIPNPQRTVSTILCSNSHIYSSALEDLKQRNRYRNPGLANASVISAWQAPLIVAIII